MISNDSTVWEDTLLAVEEGQAVPVIGRDLLVVDTETGPQRYHRLVAERLAAELKIPPTTFRQSSTPTTSFAPTRSFMATLRDSARGLYGSSKNSRCRYVGDAPKYRVQEATIKIVGSRYGSRFQCIVNIRGILGSGDQFA